MLARYGGGNFGRFLSPDPSRRSARSRLVQSWNRYSYVLNDPIELFDPSGESPVKYLVRTLKGAYRIVKRSVAVRKARAGQHAVKVVGPGSSRKARGVVKEAFRGKGTIRHTHGSPHWQPKRRMRKGGKGVGQVHYDLKTVVAAAASIGAAASEKVGAATGSEASGKVVQVAIDFVNPAQDIQEAADLVTEIGTDIIELVMGVELDEQRDVRGKEDSTRGHVSVAEQAEYEWPPEDGECRLAK